MLAWLARTLPALARARLRPGATVSRIRRRVSPARIDANLHLNQAAYAELTELARVDWLVRSGAWARWRAAGLNPVVAEQTLVYRRELRPFQAFELDTRAVAVDGRLLVSETCFLVGDRVHAKVVVKLIFVGKAGVLDPAAAEAACAGLVAEPLGISEWRVTG